jgi:hypothetical protein
MEKADLDKTKERCARMAKEKAIEVSAWLRRRTCLSEEEILENVLKPIADMAFDAGQEVGNVETLFKAERGVRQAKVMFWLSVTLGVVCVVWMVAMLLR